MLGLVPHAAVVAVHVVDAVIVVQALRFSDFAAVLVLTSEGVHGQSLGDTSFLGEIPGKPSALVQWGTWMPAPLLAAF